MTWFFIFMTIFGWRVSPITGNTSNLKEACYGSGLNQFCIVAVDVIPHKKGSSPEI